MADMKDDQFVYTNAPIPPEAKPFSFRAAIEAVSKIDEFNRTYLLVDTVATLEQLQRDVAAHLKVNLEIWVNPENKHEAKLGDLKVIIDSNAPAGKTFKMTIPKPTLLPTIPIEFKL